MRALILSDIHANKPALDAVIDHAYMDGARYGAVFSLGDALGYGPHPREVLEVLRGLNAQCLLGNHDLGLLQLVDGQRTATVGTGTQVLVWQIGRLSERDLRFVRTWKDVIEEPHLGARLRHGSPLSLNEYTDLNAARRSFREWGGTLALVGHTHVPAAFATLQGTDAEWMRHQPLAIPEIKSSIRYPVPPKARVILNPGSIGQPRDGDPRAAYGVYDTERRCFEVFRVPYDVDQTQRDLRASDLPRALADRLGRGQ
ncbi:metallophosphoesterase family protein [Deinococcus radiophilus]|uniref:Metallophosphoesterase n=1 Tax=Deinococcus radiophilus TaxID=32062 RepID=A0A3S0KL03_9DEIO|nr:metallophosphoesterase family protein [Deinococcus radiophilus]RTR29002.1 metallophosphoesterase [Deinococcus radiophilus]UFA49585.1 metallophosphoesterase family protein [Deinococcus radiophilus]